MHMHIRVVYNAYSYMCCVYCIFIYVLRMMCVHTRGVYILYCIFIYAKPGGAGGRVLASARGGDREHGRARAGLAHIPHQGAHAQKCPAHAQKCPTHAR